MMQDTEISGRIEELLEKKAYLIDIFPEKVPYDPKGRYFDAEKFFRQNSADIYRRFTDIIMKLYCYYDIAAVSQDGTFTDIDAEHLAALLGKSFGSSTGFVNLLIAECDTLLAFNCGDLYMTVYNAHGNIGELISQLVRAEGLFFRAAP